MVKEEHLRSIAKKFFAKIAELRPSTSGCFLFDTTNFFTFMAGDTESELAKRGKNKEGRDWLRQIGLALLKDRQTRLPFFYREYKGNRHSCLCWNGEKKKALRMIEEPSPEQAKILAAFGYEAARGVLQKNQELMCRIVRSNRLF